LLRLVLSNVLALKNKIVLIRDYIAVRYEFILHSSSLRNDGH
jgi:hypothetical protein